MSSVKVSAHLEPEWYELEGKPLNIIFIVLKSVKFVSILIGSVILVATQASKGNPQQEEHNGEHLGVVCEHLNLKEVLGIEYIHWILGAWVIRSQIVLQVEETDEVDTKIDDSDESNDHPVFRVVKVDSQHFRNNDK